MKFLSPLILLFLLIPGSVAFSVTERFVYNETTGLDKSLYTWTLELTNNVRITSVDKKATFLNVCKTNGDTLRWEIRSPEQSIASYRQNNWLIIEGKDGKKEIRRRLEIDDAPWYQTLSYSLRPLVLSKNRSAEFWMIRPEKYTAHKVKARKEAVEKVIIGGNTYNAQKVHIQLTGAMSLFWKADYWFRLEDGVFIRYRSVQGPPSTPETIVEIQPE